MRHEDHLELAVLGSFITFLRLLRQNEAAISGSLWDILMYGKKMYELLITKLE